MSDPTLPLDYNKVRQAIAREIIKVTGLDPNKVIYLEPEQVNQPRPPKPYFGFKFTSPAQKIGDDDKRNVLDANGNPTTQWVSGGVRKLTVSFECFGTSHEEAYNYMGLWQTSLDMENVQADLRTYGLAVWQIGNVADLSALLNTGYEGRAQMDCFFGIAMNLVSDLGSMETVEVKGTINTNQGTVTTDQTVT